MVTRSRKCCLGMKTSKWRENIKKKVIGCEKGRHFDDFVEKLKQVCGVKVRGL